MTKKIDAILDSYNYNTLWEMARAAGMEVNDSQGKKLRKRQLLPKMRDEFFNRARVLASLEELNERERAVLDRLLLRGGTAPTKSLRREIVRARLATKAEKPKSKKTSRYYHYHASVPYASVDEYIADPTRTNSRVFEDVMARLTYHGLVFSEVTVGSGNTPYKVQFHPGPTLYIPDVIRRYLPEPEPIATGDPDLQPTDARTSDPMILLRDLYLYWDFVRRNRVSMIMAGFVAKRSLKAINEILLVPDPLLASAKREDNTGRLYLLRQLLEALKLVQKKAGQLRPTGQDALHLPEFWSWALAEQLSACLEVWPQLSGLEGWGNKAKEYNPRYSHAKQVMIDVLKTLTPTAWFDLEDIVERVQIQDVNFLFADRSRIENSRGSWYYSYTGSYYYGDTSTLLKKFDKFEAEFVSHCLAGFLYQTGAVELGYSSVDPASIKGWQVFRLTSSGQEMLGVGSAKSPAQPAHADTGKLIIQPNFHLMAMGPVSLALLAQLDLFTDREKANQGAFEYHLSRESVYRAQQLGMDATKIISFLKGASAVALPQNVRRSLEEWAAYHERIVFRTNVSLLQAADEKLLAELRDSPHTGRHLARSLTAEVALLKKNRQERLIAALVEQGLFPAISGTQPEAADNSVIIQKDGAVHPIHAVPSLHLRGRLSRLAEEGDGEWRLTPASIRRAGGSRNKVLRLLEELGKLHRGQFPNKLVEQIKAWGGYYGNATTETLTLIEFRDQNALDELSKHPDLKAYLTPFRAGQRALAVVQKEQLERVREILSLFGVHVKDGLRR